MSPNLRGALLMCGSMAGFTFNDAIIKYLGTELPLFQIVVLRGVLTCFFIYLLARRLGMFHLRFPAQDRVLVLIRCLSEVAVTYFFLNALLHMPLANVTAVLQALPLTVTLGAALFFREQVGWRRMLAIAVGFCGMLLIVRPGAEGFTQHSYFALLAVVMITIRDLVTRQMSAQVPSMMVTFATALTVTIAAGFASLTEPWVPVTLPLAGLILTASGFILLGYLCSVLVMRAGDVGFIAPFRYSGLIWALALGWMVFGDWPDPVTMLGGALVVATGLFTLFRERFAQTQPKT
ncbi:DMT family transporter [Ruegeria sp. 2012CJ41-6]|uniref:DMT family transporter n=1 Tax=Ruegeria spongiae TaxID=2942209 RepID=A0ABT0Q8J5_9RHOB|nr:DMT family transporter [Ruegeria spongiae]